MNITINQKDIEKELTNSESGMLIDELAYSIGEYTSECIYDNDYIPEPYNFDFEDDLLNNTRILKALTEVSNILKVGFDPNTLIHGGSNLQAGAQLALNYPDKFQTLLKAYTEYVKDQHIEDKILSLEYEKERIEAEQEYYDSEYKTWLLGDRDYPGVISKIKRYFDFDDVEYDQKENEIYITVEDEKAKNELEEYYGDKRRSYKDYLITILKDKGYTRKQKDNKKREERKAERERLKAYKEDQKRKEDEKRKEKLSKMTL